MKSFYLLVTLTQRRQSLACLNWILSWSLPNSRSLVNDETCFKNPENPRSIDLFITNSIGSFQKTTTVASGKSDFHKMIVTVCKASFQKCKPKEILYRNYKVFDISTCKKVLRLQLQSIKSYKSFELIL